MPRRSRRGIRIARSAALCGVVTAAVVPVASAQAAVRTIEPTKAFRRELAGIKKHTGVAVLLPARVRIEVPRGHGIEAKWAARRDSWSLSLGIGPRCGGANACFVGMFSAQRGGRPAFRRTLKLRGGVTGWYKPITCGASCSPPELQWRRSGVLYDLQFREAGRGSDTAKLVAMADSALAAGPR